MSQHFSWPGCFWQRSQPHTGSRGTCGPHLGGQGGGGFGFSSQQHALQGSYNFFYKFHVFIFKNFNLKINKWKKNDLKNIIQKCKMIDHTKMIDIKVNINY